MKRVIFFLALALATQASMAQRTAYHEQPEKWFNQGKEMFLEENYTGAQDMLEKFAAESTDEFLKEEAAYMMAVAEFRRGNENSGDILKAFIDTYPETIHRHELNFLIGSFHYDKKEWEEARFWFNVSDLDYLTLAEQEDYSFRAGYTHMQLGNTDEATRYFGLLSNNSIKYRDAADFYMGYIEYSNQNYNAAMQRFDRLRNHPEYQEEVAFYTAQAAFFDGRIDEAIRLSESFLQRYPASGHQTEMSRVLGNSYYRLGQPSRAIPYYERYINTIDRPLRGDAYFLGLSYFESGRYNDAVGMFQQAVGEADELTQNAQLHLGQTYLRLNQKQPAQMAFEAASRHNFDPQARETAMFNYALLAHETNFSVFSESITLFENFLREFPNSQYTDQVNDILAETFLTTRIAKRH